MHQISLRRPIQAGTFTAMIAAHSVSLFLATLSYHLGRFAAQCLGLIV
jgi:hypothetical protein